MKKLTSLAEKVGELLIERRQTLAVSESSSGGLISASLLSIPGASTYFMGGGVIYTHRARETRHVSTWDTAQHALTRQCRSSCFFHTCV